MTFAHTYWQQGHSDLVLFVTDVIIGCTLTAQSHAGFELLATKNVLLCKVMICTHIVSKHMLILSCLLQIYCVPPWRRVPVQRQQRHAEGVRLGTNQMLRLGVGRVGRSLWYEYFKHTTGESSEPTQYHPLTERPPQKSRKMVLKRLKFPLTLSSPAVHAKPTFENQQYSSALQLRTRSAVWSITTYLF